jgi:hypothetical protein
LGNKWWGWNAEKLWKQQERTLAMHTADFTTFWLPHAVLSLVALATLAVCLTA